MALIPDTKFEKSFSISIFNFLKSPSKLASLLMFLRNLSKLTKSFVLLNLNKFSNLPLKLKLHLASFKWL